jgi:sugar phosphate permease
MTRSSLHTLRTFTAPRTANMAVPGMGWNAFAITSLEIGNYQPKQCGLDRIEQIV